MNKAYLAATVSVMALCTSGAVYAQQDDQQTEGEVDQIVITGIRGSLQQSLTTKRNADAVVEAITAEDIGKFPDKNVAESLQRITGVSIRRDFGEGERVSIRGASANQNLTLLNGHAVATADWFTLDQAAATRSFNYLLLPSEIVGNLEVYKSTQANLDVGGIGGTINVHTRNPLELDSFTLQGSIQGAYNTLAGDVDPYGSALISWKNEDSTFGVLLAGLYQKRSLRRDGFEVLGYQQTAIADQGGAIVDTPNLVGSVLFEQERIRKGGNITVAFSPTNELDITVNGLWSEMEADSTNQNYIAWVSNVLGAGLQPTNTTVGAEGTLLAGTFALQDGVNGVVYDFFTRQANTRARSIDLDVNYEASDTLRLHGKVGFTDADGETTQDILFETNTPTGFTFDLTERVPQVSFADFDPSDPSQLSRMIVGWAADNPIFSDDEEFFAYADADKDVDLGVINELHFGVKYSRHERDLTSINGQRRSIINRIDPACNATSVCTLADVANGLTPSGFQSGIALPGSLGPFVQADNELVKALFARLTIDPTVNNGNMLDTQFDGARNSQTTDLGVNFFNVVEKSFAGYAMADFEGGGFRGNFGVRIVTSKRDIINFTNLGFPAAAPDGALFSPFGTFLENRESIRHTDILPSINVVYDISDNTLLRFAAGRALARPDYNVIGGSVSTIALLLTGTGGNAELDPVRANSFDAAIEYYPDDSSIFALGLFYKDFSSAIINDTIISRQILQVPVATDPRVTNPANNCTNDSGGLTFFCDFRLSVPTNRAGYSVQGLELNVQKALDNGFGFAGNFTFSDADTLPDGSSVPENSKYSGNATVFYENDLLSARLTYSYRSSYFINVDRGRELFSSSVDSLDASISVNVHPNVALTLDAINLLNEELYQYHDNPDKPARFYKNGRWLFFGLRFKY